jgi:PIN domain nuclease of toxin-antitoxin system
MKLLLDTHALLWSIGKSSELSSKVIDALKDTNNDILVSAVSLWEIALKHSIGKLVIGALDIKSIPFYCNKMGFTLIPLDPIEALHSMELAQKVEHKDPFDRMLVYQCIKNKFTFVSKDEKMALYKKDGLKYLW